MSVYYCYTIILAVGLVVAGLILLVLHKVYPGRFREVTATYKSWLVMIPLCLTFIGLGRIPSILGFFAISLGGLREFSCATGLQTQRLLLATIYCFCGLATSQLCDKKITEWVQVVAVF